MSTPLARQPIYDRALRLHAYELLSRSLHEGDGEGATARIVRAALHDPKLVRPDGALQFINVTARSLLDPSLLKLPPDRVVLELLETVQVDEPLLRSMRALIERGYRFALDDFTWTPKTAPLIELAAWVKLDVAELGIARLGREVSRLHGMPVRLVAEKIESAEMFARCRMLGFELFQGYYLAEPRVLGTTVQNAPALYGRLAALYGGGTPSDLLDLAAPLTGGRPAERRDLLLAAIATATHKPPELRLVALARSWMCMRLAPPPARSVWSEAGALSALEVLLDRPLGDLVPAHRLPPVLRDALVTGRGPLAEAIGQAIAHEEGPEDAALFRDAVAWSRRALQALTAPPVG